MKKYIGFIFIFAIAAALIGCGGKKVYGSGDTTISVKAGDIFTISLAENPTTGYGWNYSISDEAVVGLTKDEYIRDKNAGNLVGVGGKRNLTFEAKTKGSAVISMVYERSFDKHPDDVKISYQVEVK